MTQEVEAGCRVLLKIVVADGEVDVGETVAGIGAHDEDVSEIPAGAQGGNGGAPASAPEAPATDAGAKEPDSEPQSLIEDTAATVTAPSPGRAGERVKASPLARRIARERGVDLASLSGTGPEGRVIAEDVETAASLPPAAAATAAAAPPAPPAGEAEVVELTSTWRTIVVAQPRPGAAPVFQLSVTADASRSPSRRGSSWWSSCARAR